MRNDQGGQKVASLAANGRLIDAFIRHQQPLDITRHYLLAGGQHQQLLLSPGDPQEAVGVELDKVTRMQPTTANGLGRRWRVLPITLHDQRTASKNLAVLRD